MQIEIVEVALKNLRREGIRTFLTLIGVVIGIAAIVSLLSIGAGLTIAIDAQFKQLGANTIFVIPGGLTTGSMTSIELTDSDIQQIERIRGVKSVIPIYSAAAIMEFNGEKVNVSVMAAKASKANLFTDTGYFDVKEGRTFSGNESTSILIGPSVAEDYFSKEITIRKQILINGENFKVIGILKPQAQSFGGGPNTGATVYMSLDALRRISSSDPSPAIMFVQTNTTSDASYAADEIKRVLEKKYGEKSVYVATTENLQEQINAIFSLVTIFLVGIAGISLIVGGVGIMNAMITSVIERTKEIGLMKALGASNNVILILFLLEAGFIGMIGGIIGIIIGFFLSQIISIVGTQAGFALVAVATPEIALGALGFSMIVGMVSGFYPARRAAKLDPVVALRYE